MKKGILVTADMHLRDTVPTCRNADEFFEAQWNKLREISEIVKQKNLYWVDCGDIFHKARPSYKLVSDVINRLKDWGTPIDAAIYGNHDMPAHNHKNMDDSAFGVLCASGTIKNWIFGKGLHLPCENCDYLVWGMNYGESCYSPNIYKNMVNVLLAHDMFFKDKNSFIPNVDGIDASEFVDEWSGCYPLMFAGHNHQSFTITKKRYQFYNVGTMLRESADLADHNPSICIIHSPTDVERRYLRCAKPNVVSRKHIEKQEETEDQIASFVQSLEKNEDISLSFEGNVQIVINTVKPNNAVKIKVQGAMEQ